MLHFAQVAFLGGSILFGFYVAGFRVILGGKAWARPVTGLCGFVAGSPCEDPSKYKILSTKADLPQILFYKQARF